MEARRTPRFGISEISTPHAALSEEIEAYGAAGVEGIGIWETKLPEGRDAELADALRGHGLQASICVPAILSILPGPLVDGPEDPVGRIAALGASIRRLAAFDPVGCLVLTGPRGNRPPAEARAIVVEGLRHLSEVAGEAGVGIGLEPIRASISAEWSIITDLPQTLDLLAEVDAPNLKIIFDTWHLWDTANILADTREHAHRILGVHVSDWRDPTRSWCDHVLPGDGVIDFAALFGALAAGGYDGWYDLEVFSDDSTYGNDYPDSLWKLPAGELARRGRQAFDRLWRQAAEPHSYLGL